MEKIFDWKGNEIKDGMVIYLVQTKPTLMGRFGIYMPMGNGGFIEHWESQEDADKRNNEEYWFLGIPYNVTEKEGQLWYTTQEDDEGYTWSFQLHLVKDSTIAIKGISDTK